MNDRQMSAVDKGFNELGSMALGDIGNEPEPEDISTGLGALTEGVFFLCLITVMIMGVIKLGMIWF